MADVWLLWMNDFSVLVHILGMSGIGGGYEAAARGLDGAQDETIPRFSKVVLLCDGSTKRMYRLLCFIQP